MSVGLVSAIVTSFPARNTAYRATMHGLGLTNRSKWPAIVVDQSIDYETRNELGNRCSHLGIDYQWLDPKQQGLAAAGRQALRLAHQLDPNAWILFQPLEVYNLSNQMESLQTIVAQQPGGLIVPDRFREPFRPIQHFPVWQQQLEQAGNRLLATLTGLNIDWFSGLRIIHPGCLEHLLAPPRLPFEADDLDTLLFPSVPSVAQAGLPLLDCSIEFRRVQGLTNIQEYCELSRANASRRIAKLIHHMYELYPPSTDVE